MTKFKFNKTASDDIVLDIFNHLEQARQKLGTAVSHLEAAERKMGEVKYKDETLSDMIYKLDKYWSQLDDIKSDFNDSLK